MKTNQRPRCPFLEELGKLLLAVTLLLPATKGLAVQFDGFLAPGFAQQIYTDTLIPNQAGMAWTASGAFLLRDGATIHEYNPTPVIAHGTSVHQVMVSHSISGLSAGGYAMTMGFDGYIYAVNLGSPVLQRFDPNNWAAPAQTLSVATSAAGGYGITTLPSGQIAYVSGSGRTDVRVFTPNANPSLGTDTLLYSSKLGAIDDIEASTTGEIALAVQLSQKIEIISATVPFTQISVVSLSPAHNPDGLAFGYSTATRKLYSNNNDGTISEFTFPGPGFAGTPVQVDIAMSLPGHRAYGDLASVGPDCAFYVNVGNNKGFPAGSDPSGGINWDDSSIDSTFGHGAIVRISAALKPDGSPGECLFSSVQPPRDCITFSGERVECLGTNIFQWSFCVTNTGTLTNGHLVFVDVPPGVTVSPAIIDIHPALAPGQGFCTNVTITLDPKHPTNQLCFRIAAHVPDYSECCVVSKCIRVPECCAVLSKEEIRCSPAVAGVTWCFNMQNLSGVPVQYAVIIPEENGCASIATNVLHFNPPIAPNATVSLCVPINVISSPCDTACLRVVLADTNFTSCCTFIHCVPLRCDGGNTPPKIDCGQSVLLCDPKQGLGYVHQVTVQDPDADPLTVVWKVDGSPVKTNSIPGSVTPTTLSITLNLSPGVHVVTACVSDGNGAPTICEIDVEVGDHTPPTITCPTNRTVVAWEYPAPALTNLAQVKDNCSKTNQIKVTQNPVSGTLLSPGLHCITLTAMDLAGNVSTCTTCIDVAPLRVNVGGTTPGSLGISTAVTPADLVLTAEGVLSETSSVEYFANGQSLGKGTGATARLPWPKVPVGSYSIWAVGTRTSSPSTTAVSSPVLVYVLGGTKPQTQPVIRSVVFEDGKLRLSMQTNPGERCAIEVTESLETGSWKTLNESVGDGNVQTYQLEAVGDGQFFRIRIDR